MLMLHSVCAAIMTAQPATVHNICYTLADSTMQSCLSCNMHTSFIAHTASHPHAMDHILSNLQVGVVRDLQYFLVLMLIGENAVIVTLLYSIIITASFHIGFIFHRKIITATSNHVVIIVGSLQLTHNAQHLN